MSESTESVKRLLTAISQNATDRNILDLVRIFNDEYNEKQLRQDIKAIEFVDIIDRPGIREQLREQETPDPLDSTKGSYFIRKYILEHPEIMGADFTWEDRYEFTGHITGMGNVSVFVNVAAKDDTITTRDRDVLIEWTFTKSRFDEIFRDPKKVSLEHRYGSVLVGYVRPPKESLPICKREIFADSENGSLSFTNYRKFISGVLRELKREGITDYYIDD